MECVKFLDTFFKIFVKIFEVTFISLCFSDTVIPVAELMKFLAGYSLKILNRSGDTHAVSLEFGNINKKCIRLVHRCHKSEFFEHDPIGNLYKIQIPAFFQFPAIFRRKIPDVETVTVSHGSITHRLPLVGTCTFSDVELTGAYRAQTLKHALEKIRVCVYSEFLVNRLIVYLLG